MKSKTIKQWNWSYWSQSL